MSALFYFLIWAAVIFVMMRFGCGAHVMGHGHGKTRLAEPGSCALAVDSAGRGHGSVCSKTVSTAAAKPSVHEGRVYCFCSRECGEAFEAAPEQYVGPAAQGPRLRLENSHA